MCRPASFIITKKQVFWSKKSDSHEDIVEEFKLKEQDVRGNYTFVRVEITPPDEDYTLPFNKWIFATDQDVLPKWYDKKKAEKETRKHLKDWRKAKIIMPTESRILNNGDYIFACYGTVESMCDSSTVESMYDSSTVEDMCDSSTVKVMYDSSTVEAAKDHSIIIAYIKLDKSILQSVNAVLIDKSDKKTKCYTGQEKNQ